MTAILDNLFNVISCHVSLSSTKLQQCSTTERVPVGIPILDYIALGKWYQHQLLASSVVVHQYLQM